MPKCRCHRDELLDRRDLSDRPPGQMMRTKSFVATWLLSWLLGGLGINRFYLRMIGTGILKLITFGGFGIWYLIDLILTLAGAQKEKSGHRLQGYDEHKKIAWIVTVACIVLGIIFGGITQALTPSVQPENASTREVAEAADDEPIAEEPAVEEPAEEAESAEEPVAEEAEAPAAAEEEPAVEPEPAEPAEEPVAEPEPQEDTPDVMSMSKASVYDQLTSEYGQQFTQPQADYAIEHLND